MASPRSHVRPEPAELEDARRRRNHRRQLRRRHADEMRQLRAIRKPNTDTALVPAYTGVALKSRAGFVLVHRDPPTKRAKRPKFDKRLRDRGFAWVPIGRTRPVEEYREHSRDYGDQSVKFAPDIEDA